MKIMFRIFLLLCVLSSPLFARQDLTGLKIVYAEDNESLRSSVTRLLKHYGAIVTPVASGEEARELITRDNHYDILITDNSMGAGRIRGIDLIGDLREAAIALPSILHTGDIFNDFIGVVEGYGNAKVVSKGNLNEVIAAIGELVPVNRGPCAGPFDSSAEDRH